MRPWRRLRCLDDLAAISAHLRLVYLGDRLKERISQASQRRVVRNTLDPLKVKKSIQGRTNLVEAALGQRLPQDLTRR